MSKYRKLTGSTSGNRSVEATVFAGDLDAIAREGALRVLISALEIEVTAGVAAMSDGGLLLETVVLRFSSFDSAQDDEFR